MDIGLRYPRCRMRCCVALGWQRAGHRATRGGELPGCADKMASTIGKSVEKSLLQRQDLAAVETESALLFLSARMRLNRIVLEVLQAHGVV